MATTLNGMLAQLESLADWLNAYVVKNHPDKEALRQAWLKDDDPWAARAGWSLNFKGCTSPFAPVWINEMVRRQG